jgi:hypothetical protein
MTGKFSFDNADDFLKYLKENKPMPAAEPEYDELESDGFSISVPRRDMPDFPLIDKIIVGKVIAAVALIIGLDMSEEQMAAIALIVSVTGSLMVWGDAKRRQARNERIGASEVAMIDFADTQARISAELARPDEEE